MSAPIFNGRRCRLEKKMLFRMGDPARDLDSHDKPIRNNYIVPVYTKDCKLVERKEITTSRGKIIRQNVFDCKDAPQAFRLAYGGTFYGYAPSRVMNGMRWLHAPNGSSVQVNRYMVTKVFVARDGNIYSTYLYQAITAPDGAVMFTGPRM